MKISSDARWPFGSWIISVVFEATMTPEGCDIYSEDYLFVRNATVASVKS